MQRRMFLRGISGISGILALVLPGKSQELALEIRGGIEDGGYPQLCHVCRDDVWEEHPEVYVLLWRRGMVRLCREHLEELIAFGTTLLEA